jgi:hypothetical protein
MRVVLTHDVADHAGRFTVRLVGGVAAFLHGIEDAAMHGLEAVARIRQGARDDHAHGVVEVGAAHLLLEGHGHGVLGADAAAAAVSGIAHAVLLSWPASARGHPASASRGLMRDTPWGHRMSPER